MIARIEQKETWRTKSRLCLDNETILTRFAFPNTIPVEKLKRSLPSGGQSAPPPPSLKPTFLKSLDKSSIHK